MSITTKKYNPQVRKQVTASATLPANRFVTILGALCGAGAMAYGITDIDATSGDRVSLIADGTALVLAKATITKGQKLMSDANGCAVVATSTNYAIAIACEDASADQLIEVSPMLEKLA